VPKQGEGTCSLDVNFGVTIAGERTAALVAAIMSERDAGGHSSRGAGRTQGWQDQAANVDGQTPFVGESCECMLYHPGSSGARYAGESDPRNRSSDR
jgi:hypothetical protein